MFSETKKLELFGTGIHMAP